MTKNKKICQSTFLFSLPGTPYRFGRLPRWISTSWAQSMFSNIKNIIYILIKSILYRRNCHRFRANIAQFRGNLSTDSGNMFSADSNNITKQKCV